jgi:hypothetical protein
MGRFVPEYGKRKKDSEVAMKSMYDQNMTNKTKRIGSLITKMLIITLPLITCIGCSAPPFQVYEDPRRPSFSVARIMTENEYIWFTQIDNYYLEYNPFKAFWYNQKYAKDIEMKPGKHELYIMHRDSFTYAEFKVTLDAKAGHTYEVDASVEDFTTVYRVIDLQARRTIITRYGDRMK